MHSDLVPPDEIDGKKLDRFTTDWITEYDVIKCLKSMGHEVIKLGIYSDLSKIRTALEEHQPDMIYNLLEEFDGESLFDSHVAAYLELLRIPFTGCNARGLMLARDKALTKKILTYHRLATPKFVVFPRNRKVKKPKSLEYPLIVKSLTEEASLGLAKASIVHNDEKLIERVKFIHEKVGSDAIVEQFIEGREFYIGIYGNYQLNSLPVWELVFTKSDNPEKEFYSRRAKWNEKYRKRKGIKGQAAKLNAKKEQEMVAIAKKAYKTLSLSGFARIDLRMTSEGKIYLIEANPNPNIATDDEFALSAFHQGMKYEELLGKILSLGKSWSA